MAKKRVVVKKRIRKVGAKAPCWHQRIDVGGFCVDCGVRAAIALDLPKPKVRTANQHPFADISQL